jgi:hypothetical protein
MGGGGLQVRRQKDHLCTVVEIGISEEKKDRNRQMGKQKALEGLTESRKSGNRCWKKRGEIHKTRGIEKPKKDLAMAKCE